MDRILSNRLGSIRRSKGLTQRELADTAGVSRAEVSAVETGRQTPSTATALKLAEALDRAVEDIFSLSLSSSPPEWAIFPERASGRFWLARVGGRDLLFPVEPTALGSVPHDGTHGPDGIQLGPGAGSSPTLVLAGCDPAVGLLASELARRHGVRLLPLLRGSGDALELLRRGLVHAAGIHWSGEANRDENREVAARKLGAGFHLLHFARWQEGIALDSTLSDRSPSAIARARLRWIAREKGSAAREVLERFLGERRRFRHEARDHRAVATAIRSGFAQAGIAVRLAAEEAGLGFVLLQREDYELCCRDVLRDDEPLAALRSVLRGRDLRRLTDALPGTDAARMGEERRVA